MPTMINSLRSGHKCYRCKKIIRKGEGAVLWDYADKKMYHHLGDCPKGGKK